MKAQDKIKELNRTYLLVMITRRYGPINQTLIEELTWLDLETLNCLTTTLDPSYRNYKNWHSVLTNPKPEGIYKNLTRTDRLDKNNNQILSADSHPECLINIDQETLQEVLTELATPKFNQLFD